MVLGKKVAIFDCEGGRNSAPRDGQKRPCFFVCLYNAYTTLLQKTLLMYEDLFLFVF